MSISGVVITQNEERNIETCINNLGWVDDIVIIDGGSTDSTIDIIKSMQKDYPIRLYKNKFNGHFGDQKNLGISLTLGDWVFVLDSDEIIEAGLSEELYWVTTLNRYDAISIPRKNYLDGVKTKIYPDHQARFFRAYCRYAYAVHEELVAWKRAYRAKNHVLHYKSAEKQEYQNSLYLKRAESFKRFMRTKEEATW